MRAVQRTTVVLALGAGWAAPAGARPGAHIEVVVDPAAQLVRGHLRLTLDNTAAVPLSDWALWLYPNHLAVPAPALGDVNFHWLYPAGFESASLRLTEVRVDGRAAAWREEDSPAGVRTLARVSLPAPLGPGAHVVIEVAFVTRLPERLGGFGCRDGRCRLMGGFYPMPLGLGPGGFDLAAPSPRLDVELVVTAPSGLEVRTGAGAVRSLGAPLHLPERDVPYGLLDVGPPLAVAEAPGVRLLHAHARPPPGDDEVLPYVREDWPGLVLRDAGRALSFLAGGGLRPPPGAAPVLLVEAPLRHELVQVHGPLVLVSDRLFRVFPVERVRKFHSFELVRAVAQVVLADRLAGVESDEDRELVAAVLAWHVVQSFAWHSTGRIEYARELLGPLAFIPAVDQLIYAPLIASSGTYFGDVDDRDRIRDDVLRFASDRPGPRLVYEKLLDLLGPLGMARVVRLVAAGQAPLRRAAAAVFGADLDWFWRQCLGPRRRVNYRLAGVRAQPRAGGTEVSIDVVREGDPVREPVEVRVIDRAGATHDLLWSGAGPATTLGVALAAPLASVEIDPRRRLVETTLDGVQDARFDNRQPHRWRLLYNGFGALLNLSAATLNLAAGMTLKRQHDLERSLLAYAYRTESVAAGVGVLAIRHFGPAANDNRLAREVFAGLSADRLRPSFGQAGAAPTPGWRVALSLGFDHDDRAFRFDPWRAVGVSLGAQVAATLLDDGRRLQQASLGVELVRLFALAPGHVLGFDLDLAGTVPLGGSLGLRSQLVRAGGPGALRGYGADELFGRARATARVELRNRFVSDLDWNLGHVTFVRALGGTLFAEAAAVSRCETWSAGGADIFTDVGYSLRALHDVAGVQQALFSLDVAVPLDRRQRTCFGQDNQHDAAGTPLGRPPVVVLLSFLPSF